MSTQDIFWKEEKEEIKEWDDVKRWEAIFLPPPGTSERWIFRGERLREDLERRHNPKAGNTQSCDPPKGNHDEEYLETHLEKAFRLCGVETDDDKIAREREIIRTFQRKASLYLEREPDKDDVLEWLAIMRHHGAPTRLLDCVYSFYVAVYFALNANEEGIVWALNTKELTVEFIEGKISHKSAYERLKEYFNSKSDVLGIGQIGDKLADSAIACYLLEARPPLACVYPVNPFRLNERLTVQQGLFILQGDISRPFKQNLITTFGGNEETRNFLRRVKITPERTKRNEILKKLKEMNISNEALFPGLDGFARSVGESLAYPRPFNEKQA